MFENIVKFFKNLGKKEKNKESSDTAKERLHLVLMQDRANVSADFLELMKQEIIEVIKKYIDIDEKAIDVRLTNKTSDDGTVGVPALYANIPIVTIKDEARKANVPNEKKEETKTDNENKDEKEKDKKEIEENNKTEENEEAEKIIDTAEEIKKEVTKKVQNEENKKETVSKEKEVEEKNKKEEDEGIKEQKKEQIKKCEE